jgi:hypothetical protein
MRPLIVALVALAACNPGPQGARGLTGPQGPAGVGLDKARMYEVDVVGDYGVAEDVLDDEGNVISRTFWLRATASCADTNDVLTSGWCEFIDDDFVTLPVTGRPSSLDDPSTASAWDCSFQLYGAGSEDSYKTPNEHGANEATRSVAHAICIAVD